MHGPLPVVEGVVVSLVVTTASVDISSAVDVADDVTLVG